MSVTRITGLASGLDIDSMVSSLMKAERTKLDKLQQNKQLIQWTQDAYNDMNKEFANFILDTKKDFGLTQTTASGVILNKSVSSLDWVKKATASDTTIADVTGRADALDGNYTVNVTSLASNWSAASAAAISTADKTNLQTQFGLAPGATINFTITTDQGTITVNRTAAATINDIVNDINNANKGVTAVYDSVADRFFLQTSQTGSGHTIKIVDNSTSDGTTRMNFITGAGSKLKLQYDSSQDVADNTQYAGTDAQIDFGAAKNITYSSNNFTLNGLNFSLKKTGSFTVGVSTDVDGVYQKIQNFVDKYNALVEKVGGKLSEKRYSDYQPLTQDQRSAMSETQITQWEAKAKSGLLNGDMYLERTMQSVRSGLYQQVTGVTGSFDQLTEIGITTESYSSGTVGGKLQIDKAKLTDAIAKDADGVLNLLFKQPNGDLSVKPESEMTAAEIAQKRSESGLVTRLYDNLVAGMKDIINKAGTGDNADLYRNVNSTILLDFVTKYSSISMLDKDVLNVDKSIVDVNDYLTQKENSYYDQFTAMEEALNKMNQQSAWLASQLGQSSNR